VVIAAGHPFDWHLHVAWLLALPVVVGGYLWTVRRRPEWAASGRQQVLFVLGAVVLVGAVTWPLGDLAAHWLLLALVLQRLLLTLAVPPLLVLGTPRPLIARLTRPALVDAVLRVAVRPLPAIGIVTVVAVGTLTTGAVDLAARSDLFRVLVELLVLASGFVLWAPVLSELPGAPQLSALGRGGYLIVQSIVPSFLSIVWIFARHSLYPSFSHEGKVVGMTPLLDQQLAGFLAKLSTIAVLWTVAFVIMTRAEGAERKGKDTDPLLWSDVERELERADRRERKRSSWRPPAGW
jgi:cytochrome c oxidase assembly factor CtaG